MRRSFSTAFPLFVLAVLLIADDRMTGVKASAVYPDATAIQSITASQEAFLLGPFNDDISYLGIHLPDGFSSRYLIEKWTIKEGGVTRGSALTYELQHGGVCQILQHGNLHFPTPNTYLSGIRFVCAGGVTYTGSGALYSTMSTFFVMSDDGRNCEQDQDTMTKFNQDNTSPSVFKPSSQAFLVESELTSTKMDMMGGKLEDDTTFSGIQLLSVSDSGQGDASLTGFWSTRSGTEYSLTNHSSVYHAPSGLLYVFGGYTNLGSNKTFSSQMFTVDMTTSLRTMSTIAATGPGIRQGVAMALINATSADGTTSTLISPNGGDFIFVFGGLDGITGAEIAEGDDWGFEISTQTWFSISIPAATIPRRAFAAMAAAADGPYVILHGGTDYKFVPIDNQIYKVDLSSSMSSTPTRASFPVPINTTPPTSAPPPPTTPTSRTCTLPQPTGFGCVDGTWVSEAPIVTTTISIPNAPVIVVGDFNVSEVTLGGLGSSIQLVNGCAAIDSVTVTLTEAELEELARTRNGGRQPTTLISQASYCNTFSSSISVSVKAPKSCKKASATSSGTNTNTLSALFAVDSKSCQNRWIILGCVLGGVLLIILILLLVFTQNNKARECIRPYSKRNAETS